MATDPQVILQAGRGVTPVLSPAENEAIAQVPQMQRQRMALQQQAIEQGQALEEDRRLLAAQRVQQQAGNMALASAIKKRVDPQTGEFNHDYQGVADDLAAAGFALLAGAWLKGQNENAEAIDKLTTAKRAHQKTQLEMLGDLAYGTQSPDDFVANVGLAAAHGLIDEPTAHQTVQQVQEAGGDAWTKVRDHFAQFSPKRQAKEVEEQKTHVLGPDNALVTGAGTVIATGAPKPPPPITPYQAAELKRQQAQDAETHRANLAKEAAANPLAALTGPQGASAGPAPAMLTGDDFLKTLPGNVATEVKAYAEGRRPFPAGFALKSPYFQSLIQMVGQYDPTFDAVNYNARAKTRQAFSSRKEASTVNALNTVVQHLDRLSQAADGLKNFDTGIPGTTSVNWLKNTLSQSAGRPEVGKFETDKKAVVDELTRAWRQAGGSESDIKSWSAVLDNSNSPTSLHTNIAEMGHLLEGKIASLQNQYEQGMGTATEANRSFVTPEARRVLGVLEQKASGASVGTAPDLSGLAAGKARKFTSGPHAGETWTIGADGQPKQVS